MFVAGNTNSKNIILTENTSFVNKHRGCIQNISIVFVSVLTVKLYLNQEVYLQELKWIHPVFKWGL